MESVSTDEDVYGGQGQVLPEGARDTRTWWVAAAGSAIRSPEGQKCGWRPLHLSGGDRKRLLQVSRHDFPKPDLGGVRNGIGLYRRSRPPNTSQALSESGERWLMSSPLEA